MRPIIGGIILPLAVLLPVRAQQPTTAPAYREGFQKVEPGSLPEGMKVQLGEFEVRQEQANRFLELSIGELNAFGLLLGPDLKGDSTIQSRLRSWSRGRRFSEMGIGLSGAGGYKLWLMPAISELQLKKGEQVIGRVPIEWEAGAWMHLRLDVRRDGERWRITGKAWRETQSEPREPMVTVRVNEEPVGGRASLWATPYSETPIQFDDVEIDAR